MAVADTAIDACPARARSACEAYRAWIEEQVRLKRNAKAIYQDLVDRFGFSARYNSVKRFVRSLRRVQPEQFDRLEFLPGEEAQVDYGEGAPTRNANTGRYRRPRLFIMTLRYSRRSFRCVVSKSSQETWCRLHEQAFRYFGGVVSYVVLDYVAGHIIEIMCPPSLCGGRKGRPMEVTGGSRMCGNIISYRAFSQLRRTLSSFQTALLRPATEVPQAGSHACNAAALARNVNSA